MNPSSDDPHDIPALSHTQWDDLPAANPLTVAEDGNSPAGLKVMFQPGQVLSNRYEIIKRIGCGGMGAVFSAHDRNRDCKIAIKVMLPGLLQEAHARERFMNEARISSALSHPNIIHLFDVQNEGRLFFLTMELLEGESLRQRLDALAKSGQRMDVPEALRITQALCDALKYAHHQTIHRDIKPENVFLCNDRSVKLMDFGIARLLRTSQLTMTGMSMGTAYYMSPEQLKGGKDIDGRADEYAVAVLLYEMLTGQLPAGRVESARKLRTDVSRQVSHAIDTALSAQPADRYHTIDAFASALQRQPLPIRRYAQAASIILALGTAIATYPRWRGPVAGWIRELMPSASDRADAIKLMGEVDSLSQRLDNLRRETSEKVSAAESHADKLTNDLRQSRDDSEKHQLSSDLAEAQKDRDFRRQWQAICNARLFSGEAYLSAAGLRSLCKADIDEKQFATAVQHLVAAKASLTTLINWPDDLEFCMRNAKQIRNDATTFLQKLGSTALSLDDIAAGKKRIETDLKEAQTAFDTNNVGRLGEPLGARGHYELVQAALKTFPNTAVTSLLQYAQKHNTGPQAMNARHALADLFKLDPNHAEAKKVSDSVEQKIERIATLLKTLGDVRADRADVINAALKELEQIWPGHPRLAEAKKALEDRSAKLEPLLKRAQDHIAPQNEELVEGIIAEVFKIEPSNSEALQLRAALHHSIVGETLAQAQKMIAKLEQADDAAMTIIAEAEFTKCETQVNHARSLAATNNDLAVVADSLASFHNQWRVLQHLRFAEQHIDELPRVNDVLANMDAALRIEATSPRFRRNDRVSRQMWKAKFDQLLAMAKGGDSEAMWRTGECFEHARGVRGSDAEALAWYQKSADSGNAEGMARLGAAYAFAGLGLSTNDTNKQKVSELLTRAADSGSPAAMLFWGNNEQRKEGAEALNLARQWYAKAMYSSARRAWLGDADSMHFIAIVYLNARGVPKDVTEAVRWLSHAGGDGQIDSMCTLGKLFDEGKEVPRDRRLSRQWYEKAAELGDRRAMFFTGALYDEDDPNATFLPEHDELKALNWYRKAAEMGDAASMYFLGTHSQTHQEALKWYLEAANSGYGLAMLQLGNLLCTSNEVQRNYSMADQWYRRAADKGIPQANFQLGQLYEKGLGHSKDENLAIYWYRKGATLGSDECKAALAERGLK